MISNKNFSRNPNPDVGSETEFERCNFSQSEPVFDDPDWVGVPILTGQGPCIFTNCNLVNCEPPAGSIMIKCNTTIRRTKVQTDSDVLTLDGVDIVTPIYHDIIYGRQTDAGVYEYHPTPVEIPNNDIDEV